jgi:hypothetical protein
MLEFLILGVNLQLISELTREKGIKFSGKVYYLHLTADI